MKNNLEISLDVWGKISIRACSEASGYSFHHRNDMRRERDMTESHFKGNGSNFFLMNLIPERIQIPYYHHQLHTSKQTLP